MQLSVRKLVAKLKAIWNNPDFVPIQPVKPHGRHRAKKLSQRQTFGDAQLSLRKPLMWMMIRGLLVFPIGAVGLLLCVTIIGLPLGIPIMLWVGAFCSKPLRKHPTFDVTRTSDEEENDWRY